MLAEFVVLCLWFGSCAVTEAEDASMTRALKLMSETPLIDGHNDLPWQLRGQFNNQIKELDLHTLSTTHTNIRKIKQGRLGAQFWSAYVPCQTQYKDAVRQTLEQIDVIHRMCEKYTETFMFATSSQESESNQIASCSEIHIPNDFLLLRADNWLVDTGSEPSRHNGLSSFGKQLIGEMNRLGVMIDLAHAPLSVMNQVLDWSKAPVIFSHSSAYSVCPHRRNVPDEVLVRVNQTGGIVMVNFYNDYVTCSKTAKLSDVADHFDHIKKVGGAGVIGFGGDYDGVSRLPEGLEDVSKVPSLVAELLRRGWTDEEVKAALGQNLLRVMKEVERVRDSLNSSMPDDVPIPYKEVENPCRTSFGYQNAGNEFSLSRAALLLILILQAGVTFNT
uniref:Dipeptidase n=1 Tax=Nothobranchius furzeri TaxID=105023 RepID=A0A8C6MLC6_NOTFU